MTLRARVQAIKTFLTRLGHWIDCHLFGHHGPTTKHAYQAREDPVLIQRVHVCDHCHTVTHASLSRPGDDHLATGGP